MARRPWTKNHSTFRATTRLIRFMVMACVNGQGAKPSAKIIKHSLSESIDIVYRFRIVRKIKQLSIIRNGLKCKKMFFFFS